MELTQEDINNLLIFLGRVELRGTESMAHAVLIQKLKSKVEEEKDAETET